MISTHFPGDKINIVNGLYGHRCLKKCAGSNWEISTLRDGESIKLQNVWAGIRDVNRPGFLGDSNL